MDSPQRLIPNLTKHHFWKLSPTIEVNKFKTKKQFNLELDNSKGSNYMTQLERVLMNMTIKQIRHSTKGGTQIEPKEWH